jgi:hypothetical protein
LEVSRQSEASYEEEVMGSNKSHASTKQIAANRRSAARSTGPKTKRGKNAVKRNALKHGLLADDALLPGEDVEAFNRLRESIHADLDPVGAIETALVERIVDGLWRLRRVPYVEAGVFENEIYAEVKDREDQGIPQDTRAFRAVFNPAPAPSSTDRARVVQDAGAAEWGAAFTRDANHGNAFSKLSRYETAIERRIFTSLHELQRLQSAREGTAAPIPVAADINVSVAGE